MHHGDSLQLPRRYSDTKATLRSFRADDLLGVTFAAMSTDTQIRSIGNNPRR
ncbi:hypothetical protein WJ438_26015 [Streptomyces sp. GD-15H]|uniref:hypothetical protein n=1 Tax=Streptomyces sp. GD-15H TaxID=3129112 RepID=UPI003252B847